MIIVQQQRKVLHSSILFLVLNVLSVVAPYYEKEIKSITKTERSDNVNNLVTTFNDP